MAACGRHFSSGVRHRAHLGRLVSQSGVLLKSTGRGRRHCRRHCCRHGYRRETISPFFGLLSGFPLSSSLCCPGWASPWPPTGSLTGGCAPHWWRWSPPWCLLPSWSNRCPVGGLDHCPTISECPTGYRCQTRWAPSGPRGLGSLPPLSGGCGGGCAGGCPPLSHLHTTWLQSRSRQSWWCVLGHYSIQLPGTAAAAQWWGAPHLWLRAWWAWRSRRAPLRL